MASNWYGDSAAQEIFESDLGGGGIGIPVEIYKNDYGNNVLSTSDLISSNFDGIFSPSTPSTTTLGAISVGDYIYLDENDAALSSTTDIDKYAAYSIVSKSTSGSNTIIGIFLNGELFEIEQSSSTTVAYRAPDTVTTGTAGWAITSKGNAIFSNVFVRGEIQATSGYIGGTTTGWSISSGYIVSTGGTKKVTLDGINGKIYIGTGTPNNPNTPFYTDGNSSFSLADRLYFDGNYLYIQDIQTQASSTSTPSDSIFIKTGPGTGALTDSGDITIDTGTVTGGTSGTISIGAGNTSGISIGNSISTVNINSDTTITGTTVIDGKTYINSSGVQQLQLGLTGLNASIEIGRTDGNSGINTTPYIDFHSLGFSSGSANDYDVRLITLGGTQGVSGAATLYVEGSLVFNGHSTTINSPALNISDKTVLFGVAAVKSGLAGTVSNITGTGPWTATLTLTTGITSGLVPGQDITGFIAGTGTLYGGSPTTVRVTSITARNTFTYTVTGGTTPTAGTVTGVSLTGSTDNTANNGGFYLSGANNKYLVYSTGAYTNASSNTGTWNSSESFNLAGSTLDYRIIGTSVLSSTALFGAGTGTAFTIGAALTTGSISIGGLLTSGNINIGAGTSWTTGAINIGTGTVESGNTKTIGIGTNGAAGSFTNITIGSVNGTSNTIIYGNIYRNSDIPLNIDRGTGTTAAQVVQFRRSGSGAGGINASVSTAPTFIAPSDYRLKENIEDYVGGIEVIKKTRPRTFSFVADEEHKVVVGFIAHEYDDVNPDFVIGEKDAVDENGNPIYQSIETTSILPYLIAANKELIEKVEMLEQRLAILEG